MKTHQNDEEYVVSELLKKSNLGTSEFICYETEQILYKHANFRGCKSQNFLKKGQQIITLERLYKSRYNRNFMQDVWKIEGTENRLRYVTTQVEKITGIRDFGKYMSKMLTIDAITLNEDRHFHNIAVILNADGKMSLCPFFDHGAGLLADTTLDYPMDVDTISLMSDVKAKTICESFDDALNAAESLFGIGIHFDITKKEIDELIDRETNYPADMKNRVKEVLHQQLRKYRYLF